MRDIPFVDAHIHLWDLGRLRYPWLAPPFADDGPNGSVEAIAATYLLDDYLADADGWTVAGLVHVEAGADAADAEAETKWLEQTAEARGLPSGIVAFAALDDPALETRLARHARHGRVRGVRHIVNWHADPRRTYTPRDLTGDDTWRRGFALLGKYNLSFDLQAYPGQFAGLARLIAAHPGTPVVINHLGMPDRGPAGRAAWRAGLGALAALPNTFIKLSGAGFIDRHWDVDVLRPYVLDAIDLFTPARALVASDFPTDKLFGSFGMTLGAHAEIIAEFSDGERRAMWGRNANRVYRLGLAGL